MLRIKRRRTQARCDINGNPRYNTMNATPLQSVYKNCNTYLNLMCGRPSAVPIVKNRTPKGNEATCTGKRGCMINNCSCNVKFDEDGEFKISYIPNYHSSSDVSNNMINGCCKGTPYRNPILGYRKQLFCGYTCNVDGEQTDNSSDCAKKPTNTVYKDPYAKSCGGARASVATDSACYQPVIRRIQNRNGFVNDQYNYSTKQYLNRRCRTYRQQAFNFLSSKPLQTITTTKCNRGNHQYATRCHGSTSTLGEGNDSNNKPQCIIDCSNCIVGCKPGQKCTGQVKCAGYSLCDTKNNNCCATYKPNNSRFSRQGAVSGGSRINRLKYQTQLRAQSTYINMDTGSSACPIKCGYKTGRGTINAVNGTYPVMLYRNTYPVPNHRYYDLCLKKSIFSCNGIKQRCYINKYNKCCRHAPPH